MVQREIHLDDPPIIHILQYQERYCNHCICQLYTIVGPRLYITSVSKFLEQEAERKLF